MKRKNLTYDNRKTIERLYSQGVEITDIAKKLGLCVATIYRELARGDTGAFDTNGRSGYNAELAQKVTLQNRKRCGRKASSGQA